MSCLKNMMQWNIVNPDFISPENSLFRQNSLRVNFCNCFLSSFVSPEISFIWKRGTLLSGLTRFHSTSSLLFSLFCGLYVLWLLHLMLFILDPFFLSFVQFCDFCIVWFYTDISLTFCFLVHVDTRSHFRG